MLSPISARENSKGDKEVSCNFPIIEASLNRNDRGTQKSPERLGTSESDALDRVLSPQELQGKKSELF